MGNGYVGLLINSKHSPFNKKLMKKSYQALMCMAGLAIVVACGGNGNKNAAPEEAAASAAQTTEAAAPETPAPETPASSGAMTVDEFSAQLQEFCGVAPIISDKMTKILVRKDAENDFFIGSPVTDDIDGESVQRDYFNAFAKVADGNSIYGFHMDQSRGTDAFKNYDDYVKFIQANGDYNKATYGFDYKGKPVSVYCSVSFGDFGLRVKGE